MDDDLTRAQHYRAMAGRVEEMLANETNEAVREQLQELAAQYERWPTS